jgi:cardiolipin synthase A/B
MSKNVLDIGTGYTAHNAIELVTGVCVSFDLLESLIDEAKETIHLQIYIYEADETGIRITEGCVCVIRNENFCN